MRNILKDLHLKRHVPRMFETKHHFNIGKVLLVIKNKSANNKAFLEYARTDVGYSKSFSYFLIDFATLCMEFPKLKTVSVSIGSIKTRFAFIKQQVRTEAAFWQ